MDGNKLLKPMASRAACSEPGSHRKGAQSPPLLETTIGEALRDTASAHPTVPALVSVAEGINWTFAELDERVDRLASGLLSLGLVPGDRVAVWAPNCAAWTLLQFATARAGLVFVTFNTAYRKVELGHVLALSGARAIVTVSGYKDIDYVEELGALAASALEFRIMLGSPAPSGYVEFEALANTDVGVMPSDLSATDPVNIQFTSGTTGRPKGVILSHRNILNNGMAVGVQTGLRAGDRLCIPVPLYHCFGMVMGNLACIALGATMIYPASGFDPKATLRAIAQEHATHCYGVPTMFIAMLAEPEFSSIDLTSLRGGIMAGSTCPVDVMKRVMEQMNMTEITIAYGMTETSPVSTQTALDDPLEARVETVGRVLPHLEVKIVDESGNVVPCGVQGELCTRGYSVMGGYWGDPEATAAAIDPDGFMHSGDLATMDEDGYVRITGRAKDMIIRGGENISPREVEDYLHTHRDIVDVAVVGIPDEKFGEAVCAWIVVASGSAPSADDIARYCRGRLAHFKVPTHIRLVDALPLTPSGKVQKYLIRKAMADAV